MAAYKTNKRRNKWAFHWKILISFHVLVVVVLLYLVIYLPNLINFEDYSKSLSQQVIHYQPEVEKQLSKYNKEQYTGLVLALMMQESGGRGNDPMQASESYCGEVGCINDKMLSIEKGVDYFISVLDKANGDIKLALQSYNFGLGFISFVQENGGSYTEELAIEFSQMKYKELKSTGIYSCLREEAKQYNACYGDIYYVDAVLDYYPDALTHTGDKVQVAIVNE